ncbi:MAG: heavy-metal-associated domain-containing protein [Clostridiaceae bacterium]|nr:heavy-metal-associated domain-containing protein [Clostridiaceae bacterium]
MSGQNIAFNVEGMSCEHCVNAIKAALTKLNGVYDVIVDLNSKRVAVEYDEERVSADILRETIEDAGYKVR